jgi:dienelactone hydrolase
MMRPGLPRWSAAAILVTTACAKPTPPADPGAPGRYATASLSDTWVSGVTGDSLPMDAVYPVDTHDAPYPIVVFGHGFLIPPDAYTAYLSELASFGYVAVSSDYPDPADGPVDNINDGYDLAAGLDWALASKTLNGRVDVTRAGVMGHSRGGKAAVLAALQDHRFKAVYGLDPVDSPPPAPVTCNPVTQCPDAYLEIAALQVPTLFVGETLDSLGALACAPASGNYAVFYAHANAPSIEVTVNGASHVSFVPDWNACGLACEVCQTPTLPQASAVSLASSYAVAFFERNLRGDAAYQTWLDGAQARARFGGEATITSK